jgi:hypothetical protein
VIRTLIIVLIIVSVFFSCSTEKKEEQAVPGLTDSTQSFDSFLFVGMVKRNPGLYKYDIKEKKYSVFWSKKKEKVVEISYSDDRQNAYFLTAREFGNLPESGLPFINRVKAYLINIETGQVTFLENIGSGLQVFSYWEDKNTFKVVINSVDKTISNYIQQRTRVYNTFGKKLQDINETYDITTQGYPLPKEKEIKSFSPDGRYSLEYGTDTLSIYLRNSEKDELILITKTSGKVGQVEWENSYLFFTTVNPDSMRQAASKLFIYSLDKREILKMLEDVEYFFVVNDLIVFGTGSGITFYNYKTQKSYDSPREIEGIKISK